MGGDFLRRILADAAQRLLLILIAATLTGVIVILLCGALTVALTHYIPIWAALVVTAAVLLLIVILALLIATRSRSKSGVAHDAPQKDHKSDYPVLATLLNESIKTNPKSTMGFALLAGIAMGIDPSLRKDIMKLLLPSANPPDDR